MLCGNLRCTLTHPRVLIKAVYIQISHIWAWKQSLRFKKHLSTWKKKKKKKRRKEISKEICQNFNWLCLVLFFLSAFISFPIFYNEYYFTFIVKTLKWTWFWSFNKGSLKKINSNKICFKSPHCPQEILPLTLGNTAMTKMGDSKFERTKYKIKAFFHRVYILAIFWWFFMVSGWRWVVGGATSVCGYEERRVLPPSFHHTHSKANTTHKPCCQTAWVAPQYAGGTLLEGGADEAEMPKNKSNHQGSLGKVFCYLLSPCPCYPQKLTGFCSQRITNLLNGKDKSLKKMAKNAMGRMRR